MATSRNSIKGSERIPLQGARAIGPTDPHQLIEISVILKHRQPLDITRTAGRFMSHAEFAEQFGADPTHIDRVRKFANDNSLRVLDRGDEVLRRTLTLAGTAAAMEKAFGIELIDYEHPDGSYRGRTGPINVPDECAPFVKAVLGLDDRPVARPHLRYRGSSGAFGARASNTAFYPSQVARLYNFPSDVNGQGQVIGLIELGGGYRPADLQHYFESQGIHAPAVKTASVDQAKNRPTNPQSADGEVMLDIEVAGSVAPGAMIVVYFAPNTTRGFQDALSMAIHDQLRGPRVISISWGAPEQDWTTQSMESFDEVAQEAAMLGITITVASGDNGSTDGMTDGKNHVDFPASSPHVLACGGTQLMATGGHITSEVAWNDGSQGGASGGGYSTVFARPAWQSVEVGQTGRGVPDVCGDAAPESGYNVLVDGHQMVIGGTSAVAPLWAGLIALLNQKLQTRLGYINQKLYAARQQDSFRDITSGSNGAFSCSTGWDAVTGLGSPMGTQMLQNIFQAQTTKQTQSTPAASEVRSQTKSSQ